MELREYWDILWQRRWVVLAVTVLAMLSNLAFSWQLAPPSYAASVRLAVKPQIEPRTERFYGYDEYYAYVASEYLVDDVINVIESGAFRDDLRTKLQGKLSSSIGPIEGKKAHRVMTVNVTMSSASDALLVAQAVGELLSETGSKYFSRISSQNPDVQIVDPPSAYQVAENRRSLDIMLRAVLGFLVGLGLALLLEYLSDTMRGAAQVESAIGLPVLGEIPREPRRRAKRPQPRAASSIHSTSA